MRGTIPIMDLLEKISEYSQGMLSILKEINRDGMLLSLLP